MPKKPAETEPVKKSISGSSDKNGTRKKRKRKPFYLAVSCFSEKYVTTGEGKFKNIAKR